MHRKAAAAMMIITSFISFPYLRTMEWILANSLILVERMSGAEPAAVEPITVMWVLYINAGVAYHNLRLTLCVHCIDLYFLVT